MSKKIIFTLVAIAIVVAAAIMYVIMAPKASVPSANREVSPTPLESPETQEDATTQEGAYVDYTKDAVASAAGTKLLFFHAPWCPQCRALDQSLSSTALPDDLTIFRVDYDSNQALRQKYGVTIQTTVVKIGDDGQLIEKYVAYDEPTFASLKANLLD